ncbi:hypothetical protein QE370_003585 [Aeromicrobium sp. SORGH_AS981]|jgi:hypothetical protein|uniref:hypothetical protein n=1 Tax=Aeromicrobium sp. SORGH_AS_0981 TaxID=3041802 RepID=UPI002864C61D|nr:hypothetical protein [Aeromicrobium sp. SORGH_AS_0981]MDR6120401.1 hypothetical protein [Aeromicrobium sp. SORGH_AS_0981]
MDDRPDDDWSGSTRRPWYNPPMRAGGSETGVGAWRWAVLGIAVLVVAAIVVIVLVDQDVLPRAWAYAVLPVAIVAAAASRVVTTLKAKAATDRRTSRNPDGPDVDES